MTNRQVAFAVAKYWGLLPHVIWEYPFRYFAELRSFYFASLGSSPMSSSKIRSSFDWDEEAFEGEAT